MRNFLKRRRFVLGSIHGSLGNSQITPKRGVLCTSHFLVLFSVKDTGRIFQESQRMMDMMANSLADTYFKDARRAIQNIRRILKGCLKMRPI